MDSKQVVRNRFKAPEGRYELVAERAQGLLQFHYQRSTRLTLAVLPPGAPEDGTYVIYNVGELIHISYWDATHKEPLRSIALPANTGRSYPTCHDHTSQPSGKDGVDTLIGYADGTVHLLSLRAQLSNNAATKPPVAATLAPEVGPDIKCVAVAWLPKTEGMFAVAFASGNVYIYKKGALLGDSSSRFGISLGSNSKSNTPHTISVCARGVHDIAPSPCGTRLAVACSDGVMRLIEVASGAVIGGFQSYYGALLCCSFSPDGRYIAAAGEDDLICVYSVADRYPVAHCQGHDSWVSRVRFDPWMQLGGNGQQGGNGNLSNPGSPLVGTDTSRVYRLASVGQDSQMCLWDVQILPLEGDFLSTGISRGDSSGLTLRSGNSHLNLASIKDRISNDLVSQPSTSSHQRKPSISKVNGSAGGITPALTRADMNIVQPSMQHRVHIEPLSDVLFMDTTVLTADHSGCVRTWKRPTHLQRLSMQRAMLFTAATSSENHTEH